MWPFKKLFSSAPPEIITAANWEPQYYVEQRGFQNLGIPGGSVRIGGRKVSEHQPWDVVSWGDMDAATCGHRTLEALMGLFALRHPACPKHFWCKPDHLHLVAQCYTAYAHQDARKRIYVCVYTWPILDLNPTTIRLLDGTDVPGVDAVSADEPLMKIQLFPMPDGSIRVTYGFIRTTVNDGSFGDLGVIDLDTAETLYCASRRVGDVPTFTDPFWGTAADPQPCYLIAHDDGQWYVGPCWRSEDAKWTSSGFVSILPEAAYEMHR